MLLITCGLLMMSLALRLSRPSRPHALHRWVLHRVLQTHRPVRHVLRHVLQVRVRRHVLQHATRRRRRLLRLGALQQAQQALQHAALRVQLQTQLAAAVQFQLNEYLLRASSMRFSLLSEDAWRS